MPAIGRPINALETALLRRSRGAATARRDACVHCHRTPLVGELVHFYDSSGGTRLVCDLCRPRHGQAPDRSGLMHSLEHERAVRVLRAVA